MNTLVKHFFNGYGIDSNKLERNIKKAKNQESKLLEVFHARPDVDWTREGLEQTGVLNAPTSSYVRAINQLERQNYIKKTEQVEGQYGNPVWKYKLK